MIELQGVTKQYVYGARVLGVVDMKIEDGEIVAVLGGRDDGKTTFLKVLAGVTECEGRVLYDGEEALAKTNTVIMQFDDLAVFKYKTFYENLAYPLKIRKYEKSEIDRRVKEAAELLGITASLYSRAFGTTLQDKKRMAIARLFLRDAKVLVLDDPTEGLPFDEARELWRDVMPLLLKKKEEGVTIVYSTSDRDEAISIADRIIVLHAGEIKQTGTPPEIYNTPESVWAAEAVDPNYNVIKAKLDKTDDGYTLTLRYGEESEALDASVFNGRLSEGYVGKDVLIGVHPGGFSRTGRTERVEYAIRNRAGFDLYTESGLKVYSSGRKKEICVVPDLSQAVLFDENNECCIMRKV